MLPEKSKIYQKNGEKNKMAISKFFLPYVKSMLKPFKAINTKIHEATGDLSFSGNPPKGEEGSKGTADFRQVGRTPEDKSGFEVKHLGDKK